MELDGKRRRRRGNEGRKFWRNAREGWKVKEEVESKREREGEGEMEDEWIRRRGGRSNFNH